MFFKHALGTNATMPNFERELLQKLVTIKS